MAPGAPGRGHSRREVAERALQEGLLRKSYELLEADDLEQAELALEQMREVAVRREDGAAQARALFLLGRIRVQVEDVARGAELASEAARLALAAEDRELAGSAYMVVGNALFESEPEQSRAAYGQALVAWNGSSSSLGMRASVTYNLAALELQLGDEGAAKLRLKEARVLAKDAGNAGLIARIDEVLQGMESAE